LIETPPTASRRLHLFPDTAVFGRRLGRVAGLPSSKIELHRFPDGESLVRVRPRGERSAIVVRSLHEPDTKVMETLLASDALRRSGARRVTLVCPYLPYMRQDRVFAAGEPVSQRVFCDLLGAAFDELVTLEPHLHRVKRLTEVFPGRARALSAAPAIADFLRRSPRETFLVGPDAESRAWVGAVAKAAEMPFVVGTKTRLGDASVRVHFGDLPSARRAVIVDDIASTGATLAEAAASLRRQGVREVDAIIVHAIFAPKALSRIRRSGVRRIVSCDSIPHPTNAIRTAGLFAGAVRAKTR